jgi:glycosyltransferase involved in cell wall biosynthesis
MRILYLHQYFATRNSITSTRSFELAKQMLLNGHSVTMITTDAFIPEEIPEKKYRYYSIYSIEGIKVIAQKNKYSNHMSYSRRIISFIQFLSFAFRALRREPADVIYATSTPLTIMIPTLIVRYIKKIPFVFEVRDLWPDAPIEMGVLKRRSLIYLAKKLELLSYKKAAHIVALSDGMKDGIVVKNIPAEKITVAENLSDFNLFQPENIDEEYKQRLIAQHGLEGKFILLHMGAMGVANGLEYLLQAAEKAKEMELNNITFVIGGDGKTKERLVEICRSKNLTNVRFLGYIPRKLVPTVTDMATITMTCFRDIPILATNSPNKFFDSLAAGKPVIVNSNGWTRKVVQTNDLGFYVDGSRPEDLAHLLADLQNKKNELHSMEEHIKAFAKEHYEVSKIYKKIEEQALML